MSYIEYFRTCIHRRILPNKDILMLYLSCLRSEISVHIKGMLTLISGGQFRINMGGK